jgi:hypothetical protein
VGAGAVYSAAGACSISHTFRPGGQAQCDIQDVWAVHAAVHRRGVEARSRVPHLVLLLAIREGRGSGRSLKAARGRAPVSALRCLRRRGSVKAGGRRAVPLCSGGVCSAASPCCQWTASVMKTPVRPSTSDQCCICSNCSVSSCVGPSVPISCASPGAGSAALAL